MRVELPPTADPRFTLHVSSLVLVPLIDTEEWIRSQLARGGFTSDATENRTTTCGWPVVVAFGVRDGTAMLRVFLRFHDVGAFGEASGDLNAAWGIVRQARPFYDGELAAISQLFA